MRYRPIPLGLLLLAFVLSAVSCAEDRPMARPVRPAAALTPVVEPARPSVIPARAEQAATAATSDIRAALSTASPEALEYHQHIATLANPFFEGRAADSAGGRRAAEYVAFHLEHVGLAPAFEGSGGDSPFFQPFSVPGEVEVRQADAALIAEGGAASPLSAGADFNALGFSGKGEATGPLAFVGYSIDEGPSGYSSYKQGDDLTGRIAVIMRYEPVNDKGESAWSNFDGWSRHAELMPKIAAAVSRGATGVILINPPGVKDPRSRVLETAKSTRFGKPIGVPALMLSPDQAKSLLRQPDGRDLMDFRRLADQGGHGVVPLEAPGAVRMSIDVDRARMDANNVGALLQGKGRLADQYLIIGAHYDHLGYGYVGGTNPNNQGKLHPGADDNASGTAGLVMLARRLAARYAALPDAADARSILFLAFAGEEMGLLGSEHFIKNTAIDSTQVVAMLNMDMIGRADSGSIDVSGMGTAEEFPAMLEPLFAASGLSVKSIKSGIGPSDHATFHKAGAPVLAFFSGLHRDYHTPSDLPHKVNVEGALRIVALVDECSTLLATRPDALTFQQTSGMQPGPGRGSARVRLGIMPGDYSGEEPGVLVGGVTEGTSAAKAGIIQGDRIIRWGGEELADAGVMMQRLRDHRPGDVVEIVVVRDRKELTIPVTLQGRGGTE